MDLEKIVKMLPVLVPYLIFMGFLDLHFYYSNWGIRIIEYLEPSEILLLFLDDLYIILTMFILFFVNNFMSKIYYKIWAFLGWKNISGPLDLENRFSKRSIITFVLFVCLTIIQWYFFSKSNDLLDMFFLVFDFTITLRFLLYLLFIDDAQLYYSITVTFPLLFLIWFLTQHDIKVLKASIKENSVSIYCNNGDETIRTNGKFYLVGKTQGYYYLFDENLNKTIILKSDIVYKIETIPN